MLEAINWLSHVPNSKVWLSIHNYLLDSYHSSSILLFSDIYPNTFQIMDGSDNGGLLQDLVIFQHKIYDS